MREREGVKRHLLTDHLFSQHHPDNHTCSCFIWCSCSRRSDTLRFIPCRLTCMAGAPAGWWITADSTVASAFFPPDTLAAPAISSSTGWAHSREGANMILPLPTESTRISHRWTRKENDGCQCSVLTGDWHLLIQYILREACTVSECICAETSVLSEPCITPGLLSTTCSRDGIISYNCRLHKTAANQIGSESNFGTVLPGDIWDQVDANSCIGLLNCTLFD